MTETQFRMKGTGSLQPRQIQIAGVFKEFPWICLPFLRIDLTLTGLWTSILARLSQT